MSGPRRFQPDTSSVREVRDFVAESLDGIPEEQVEIIMLATSELAANSVRHAGTAYTVSVERTDAELRVIVEDDGLGDPEVQDPGPFTPSGRGLLIVEQLSDAWGSSSSRGHNRVWFSMRLPSTSSPSARATGRSGRQGPERSWRPTGATEHGVGRGGPLLRARRPPLGQLWSCRKSAPSASPRR